MQKFLSGWGERIGLYYVLTQHFIMWAEGPSATDLLRVPTLSHVHPRINQNPMDFFPLPERKGREQSFKKEKLLHIPHRILSRILIP